MRRSSILNFDTLSKQRKSQPQIQMNLLQRQLPTQKLGYMSQVRKISDQLDIQPKYKLSSFKKFCNFMQSHLPPIHSDSLYLLIWNIISLLCIFYNFIIIPIGILIINFYQDGTYALVFVQIDMAILAVFVVDILAVRSRISYYQKERLITSYELIYSKYFKLQLGLDILTVIGYAAYIVIPSVSYLKLFLLLKVYSYYDINQKVLHMLITFPYLNALYKFFRLVAFIIIITNLAACIFFTIDYGFYRQQGQYYQNGMLWLTASQLTLNMDLITTFEWPIWYEYAMYYSVQSIAGCGYGNITARNAPEVLYANLLILTFFVMYTVFQSEVYTIFTELDLRSDKREQSMRQFNIFIGQNQIQKHNKEKSKFYIQSYLRRSHEDQTQQQLCSYLSQSLKVQMRLTFHTQIYSNLPIMNTIFRQSENWTTFAKTIIQSLQVKYYTKDYILFTPFSTENFRLMVIIRGRILSKHFAVQNEKVYKQWDYIGQRQFFFEGINNNQVRCLTFSKMCYFNRKEFFSLLKNYQQLNEIVKQAIQGVYINATETKQFSLSCNFCQKPHIQHFCEISNNRKRFLHKNGHKIESCQQQRQKYDRTYSKPQKVINLGQLQGFQVERYSESLRYHTLYNIKGNK